MSWGQTLSDPAHSLFGQSDTPVLPYVRPSVCPTITTNLIPRQGPRGGTRVFSMSVVARAILPHLVSMSDIKKTSVHNNLGVVPGLQNPAMPTIRDHVNHSYVLGNLLSISGPRNFKLCWGHEPRAWSATVVELGSLIIRGPASIGTLLCQAYA